MATSPENRRKVIAEARRHEKDSGSSEVQVALLTDRIVYMTEHMKRHPKDNHSRRGLVSMVTKRTTHLQYLERSEPKRFAELVKRLNLRG
ncbi:MAG TPA: 30S ribosomal protein S15 [Planctomycetota bacterium]|nr:30S ribosomal protein S15 [Planctomycetota bacterium]